MSTPNPPAAPYVGLTPYSESDADYFFGRESERDNIIANLMGSRLTVLYGPSGVGKSSVLNAGVAWHMRELSKLTLARVAAFGVDESLGQAPSPEFIVVVFSKWRDNPLIGLDEQIRNEVEKVAGLRPDPEDQHAHLSLAQMLRTWTLRTSRDFFIILDQFEDYFVYYSQANGEAPFDGDLPEAVNDHSLRVNFVISIREDALAKLDRFTEQIPNLFNSCLRIEHLSRESAYTAIKKPIDRFNQLHAASGWKVDIEPELIDAVLDQVGTGQGLFAQEGLGTIRLREAESPSAVPIEPTYLQLVMTRLWEEEMRANSRKLQLSTLSKLRGARYIVRTHVDQTMRRLEKRQRQTAMQMFVHLVSPTGLRTPQSLDDLVLSSKLDREAAHQVLTILSSPDVRILRQIESHGTTRYEIFHDVLAPAVLRWRTKSELDDQNRRARFYLFSALGLTVLLVGVLALLALFYHQKHETERARKEAENQGSELQKALEIVRRQDNNVPYLRAIMRGHSSAVSSAAFSPDDKILLTASDDRTARLWDTQSGGILATLQDQAPVTNAEFSPDGRLIVTGTKSGTVRLWRLNSGYVAEDRLVSEYATIAGHSQEVNCAAFSPDSSMIATSSVDGTARVWDAKTGNQLAELRGHSGLVNCSFFSPDSRFVITPIRR
jgi:hypothetical protein